MNKQINQLNKNEQEYKKKLKQLNELDDLNSPEGKKNHFNLNFNVKKVKKSYKLFIASVIN